MATYSLKVPDGSEADKFLSEQSNCSGFLRELVEDYLSRHRGRPGKPTPEPPTPADGITLEALTEAVYQALVRASRRGIGIVQNAPQSTALNQDDGHISADAAQTADPEATERAARLVVEQFG